MTIPQSSMAIRDRSMKGWESYEGNLHKPKVCTRGWSSGCVLMQSIWQFSLMIPKKIHLLGCTWQQLVKVSWWSAAISVRWNSKCVHGGPFWFVALNLTPKGLMDIAWCVDFDCRVGTRELPWTTFSDHIRHGLRSPKQLTSYVTGCVEFTGHHPGAENISCDARVSHSS